MLNGPAILFDVYSFLQTLFQIFSPALKSMQMIGHDEMEKMLSVWKGLHGRVCSSMALKHKPLTKSVRARNTGCL